MDEPIDSFDAEMAIATYRTVIDKRDAERTDEGKEEFQRIARRLRDSWKQWHGEDCLHEMAYGEPREIGDVS